MTFHPREPGRRLLVIPILSISEQEPPEEDNCADVDIVPFCGCLSTFVFSRQHAIWWLLLGPMKIVAINRRARFDYEIVETVEAGMLLTGAEVKSCREGHVDLRGAYVSFLGPKPTLQKMSIASYRYANDPTYNPLRTRELLLHAHQKTRLEATAHEKGMTVIPLEVRSGKFIKILLGVARGRKRLDKRQRIKERETERRLRRGIL